MLLDFDPAVTAVTCGWPMLEYGDCLWQAQGCVSGQQLRHAATVHHGRRAGAGYPAGGAGHRETRHRPAYRGWDDRDVNEDDLQVGGLRSRATTQQAQRLTVIVHSCGY